MSKKYILNVYKSKNVSLKESDVKKILKDNSLKDIIENKADIDIRIINKKGD